MNLYFCTDFQEPSEFVKYLTLKTLKFKFVDELLVGVMGI